VQWQVHGYMVHYVINYPTNSLVIRSLFDFLKSKKTTEMENYFFYIALALLAFILFRRFMVNRKASETIKNMDSKNLYLVDVREPAEFASGSVKGAVNIPLGSIQSRIKELKGKENIVVFCRSGNRSSMAADILQKNGISNVTNGGTWQNVANLIQP
jgi:phage shock protein E